MVCVCGWRVVCVVCLWCVVVCVWLWCVGGLCVWFMRVLYSFSSFGWSCFPLLVGGTVFTASSFQLVLPSCTSLGWCCLSPFPMKLKEILFPPFLASRHCYTRARQLYGSLKKKCKPLEVENWRRSAGSGFGRLETQVFM